jgi:tetratricopeptide (TPR) repeat protein
MFTSAFLALLACVPACSDEARLDRAEEALRAGDLPSAEADYRVLLDRDPDDPDALYGLGWAFHLHGDEDRAREYFKRCVRVAPQDHRGHRGLGSVALADGNVMLALTYFETALEMAPGEPTVLNSKGLALLAQGAEQEALEAFQAAQAADPARGDYGYNVADALHGLGRDEEALAVLDQALGQTTEERRFRGMLLELRARVLVALTNGRLDPERCPETAPPLLQYLDAADRALDQAETAGLQAAQLAETRRQANRRRSYIGEACPGQRAP